MMNRLITAPLEECVTSNVAHVILSSHSTHCTQQLLLMCAVVQVEKSIVSVQGYLRLILVRALCVMRRS